ncbi:MAG: tetratricopeptide repeat protein [bacterium]|nr:tetratricopeptide repeat protein [bacterium]
MKKIRIKLTRQYFPGISVLLFMAFCLVPLVSNALETTVAEVYSQSYEQEYAGYYQAAVASMNRLPVMGETGYEFHLRLGWLNYLAADYDASIAAYRQAIELKNKAIEPKLGILKPLMALHKWLDSLDVIDIILVKDSGNYLGRSRQAYCQFQLGRFSQAVTTYRDVLEDYPGDIEMISGLGWSLLRSGDTVSAKIEFEKVLRIWPEYETAKSGAEACR